MNSLDGEIRNGRHLQQVRVYYEDTDFSGIVYHASYLRFMERGRSDFLRLAGVGHDALAAGEFGEPLMFAVKRLTVEFLKPARIDEVLTVETRIAELGGAHVALAQTVRRETDALLTADIDVVLVNAAGRPRRFPAEVRRRLQTTVDDLTRD